jgi:uncharacterized membrane protein
MGIPLMGAPILLLVMFVWSGAHLSFLRSTYHSELLSHALSRHANWWLLAVAAISAVFVVVCATEGAYWYAVPGVVWLYFYISLAASRRSAHAAERIRLDRAQPRSEPFVGRARS